MIKAATAAAILSRCNSSYFLPTFSLSSISLCLALSSGLALLSFGFVLLLLLLLLLLVVAAAAAAVCSEAGLGRPSTNSPMPAARLIHAGTGSPVSSLTNASAKWLQFFKCKLYVPGCSSSSRSSSSRAALVSASHF
jgi:hypothetical protein